MRPFSLSSHRASGSLGILALAGLAWLFQAAPAPGAATIVQGKVTDPTTESGVSGVEVTALRGDRSLGSVLTEDDGRFLVTFDVGTSDRVYVTLRLEHDGYEARTEQITVTGAQPVPPFVSVVLRPNALSGCSGGGAPGGVVGYFTGPAGAEDLSDKMAIALTYSLLTRIQRVHVPSDLQPSFGTCQGAKPRNPLDGPKFARFLEADVFVSGTVKQGAQGFDVAAYVSDRYDLYMPPLRALNVDVDLDDPGAADLDEETHAAVLVAIARRYEEEARFAECVDVTVAAEQILGGLTPVIEAERARCQQRLGNIGLLPGGGP